MKRAKVAPVDAPVDRSSPLIVEQLYSVTLGNGVTVRFTSSRDALAFQAEAGRFLTDAMMSANLLLSEVYTAYRLAWPYLPAHTAVGGVVSCGALVDDAERMLDRVATDTDGATAIALKWKQLATALDAIRALALRLEQLYQSKTQGVQRHQMAVLVRRCNALNDEVRYYGQDKDTQHSHKPSGRATW